MTALPLSDRSPTGRIPAFTAVAESTGSEPGAGAHAPARADARPELSLVLDPDVDAAGRAREALDRFGEELEAEVLDDMRLLVTELVTNSVRHADAAAGEPVRLEVSVGRERVFIAVEDGGNGFRAEPRTPSSPDLGGWGLYLVDRVSDRWGVDGHGRTRVWLELLRAS